VKLLDLDYVAKMWSCVVVSIPNADSQRNGFSFFALHEGRTAAGCENAEYGPEMAKYRLHAAKFFSLNRV